MQLKYLTFDTPDPERIARFWAGFLGGTMEVSENAARVRTDSGPDLLFLVVPEPKTAKNRCHPDYHTPDMEHHAERAVKWGATETGRFHEGSRWIVFQDPDGNEFCIVEDPEAGRPG